ncbi:putative transcriptional regulator [Maricaulis maris]|uniref:Putative transcriptional regulator n=2 Tax=Maricaulaceae TaxID=2800061 RepID=A0A495D3F0_9PROT|nr:putative transcriptional regulator [Maricaulis maris]
MMSQSQQRLTDDENATMRILWDRGGASVSELAIATRQPAATTLNLLHGLRRKGAVERQQAGRDTVYRPRLNRETARTHALGRLLCGDSTAADNGLGVVVLRESDVDPKDWADLQAEIAQRRKA